MAYANPDPKHALALERFHFIDTTENAQRARELKALAFEAGDHWPEDAKVSRQGLPANAAGNNTPAVPARPMLVMRTLDQPLAQLDGQARAADMGIKITPDDHQASKETAEVFQGLIRKIEVDSHAKDAYDWGWKRMRGCGRGYWRVDKGISSQFAGDQVLRIRKILNGASVYLDPLGSYQDQGGQYEDPAGEYGFVTMDVPEATYKRLWGKTKLANAPESELTGLGDMMKDWIINGTNGQKFYRVAEYFYAEYPEGKRTIYWAKLNGVEWLDAPQEWDGHYIPLICVTGNEFNIGGQRVFEGLVQPSESPCLMLDYTVSWMAEKMGLSTMAPWIGVAGQFQSFEGWWDQANTRNFSKLEYNAVTDATGGQLLGPPVRTNDEPHIQSGAEMVGLFTNFIRSTTGIPDASLGHVNPNDKSARAIEALKASSEMGTSGWLVQQAKGIRQTGVVCLDLIPPVYDRPERVEQIVGLDGEQAPVMLNAPFTRDKEGQPQPHNPGVLARAGRAIAPVVGMNPAQVEHHKLDQGQYSVIVDVGKAAETRRQETFVGLSALAQAAPELVPRFADLWVSSMDIPDADAIAERIKPPGVDGPGSLPPEAQAIVAQKDAQIAELQKAADPNMAKVQTAAHGDATKLQIAREDNQTKIVVAEIGAKVDAMIQQMVEDRALLRDIMGLKTEAAKAAREAQHEQMIQHKDMAHDVATAAADHIRAKELSDQQHQQALEAGQQGHGQALEQQAQAAALAPPVDNSGSGA